MSKDQAIGLAIFLVCAVVGLFYAVTLFYPQWLSQLDLRLTQEGVQFWIIAIPVFIGSIAILGIGAWIGWTMATTPAPKPLEDLPTSEETKTIEKDKIAEPSPT